MRILTAAQMKAAEDAAVAAGSSYEALMENAGAASAQEIEALAAQKKLPRRLMLLCGKGNNAGDAFVVARLLAQKSWQVQVVLLFGQARLSPLAALNFGRLPASVSSCGIAEADFTAPIVVDGVFGTGFSGALPEGVRSAFTQANRTKALRVALDLPSGLSCDSGAVAKGCFQAAYTLTFGACKPGLLAEKNKPYVGEMRCLDIGLFSKS